MNREEFLRGLQSALSGAVPPAVLQENLRYYDDYIRNEVRNGRSESQVMEELGDPRLIARTILDTTPGAEEGNYEEYRPYGSYVSDDLGGGRSTGGSGTYGNGSTGTEDSSSGGIHYYDLNKWYWKLLGIAIVIGVVMLFVMVVSGILSIVIPLLPLFLIVMFVMWFVRGPHR